LQHGHVELDDAAMHQRSTWESNGNFWQQVFWP
jgi:hypothetical protein